MTWNTIALPPGWVTLAVNTGRDGNMFLDSETVTFTLSAATARTYEVRDYYGNLVLSGACSGTTLALAALPLGWYKLYLYQSGTDPDYGALIGSQCFAVIRQDAHFPDPPLISANTSPGGPFGNWSDSFGDHAGRGMAMLGPSRFSIDNADAPTTGVDTIAKQQSDATWYDLYYTNFQPDSARPRPAFLQFPNGGYQDAAHTTGVTSVVAALYPDIQYFEGPINEPNLAILTDTASWVTAASAFHNAVKAGNAAAKVLGPCPVSVNGQDLAGIDAFFAAGGGAYFDSLSFHFYNCANGDITLGRKTMDAFVAMLAAHSLSGKELWQTECGAAACDSGMFAPRQQVRFWLIQRFLLDQYGVPKERDYYFYDGSHGFWDVPAFWKFGSKTHMDMTPMIALTRVYSQEIRGKTWQSKLDFGAVENDHYLGNVFADVSGNKTIAVISGGRTDGSFTLAVTGAASLTVVSPFGTTSTATVDANGQVTVGVGLEPVYVRVPNGVTATLVPAQYGTNIATWGVTAQAGATAVERAKIFDGQIRNPFYTGDPAANPPFIDTQTLPATVTGTLLEPRRIDTVVINCANPTQDETSLIDYDLEYQDAAGQWHLVETVTEPTTVLAARGETDGTYCLVDSYYSTRSVFVHKFNPVVAGAIRLYVRATTVGYVPNQMARDAQGFGWPEVISLRNISLFCRDTLVAHPVVTS